MKQTCHCSRKSKISDFDAGSFYCKHENHGRNVFLSQRHNNINREALFLPFFHKKEKHCKRNNSGMGGFDCADRIAETEEIRETEKASYLKTSCKFEDATHCNCLHQVNQSKK